MAAYQENIAEFEQRNVTIIGASVDSQEDAQELVAMLGLTFPVAYGLNHMEFAEKTGGFYEVRRSIIHATEFIIKADGSLLNAVYGTGPIGRFDVDMMLSHLDFDIKRNS